MDSLACCVFPLPSVHPVPRLMAYSADCIQGSVDCSCLLRETIQNCCLRMTKMGIVSANVETRQEAKRLFTAWITGCNSSFCSLDNVVHSSNLWVTDADLSKETEGYTVSILRSHEASVIDRES